MLQKIELIETISRKTAENLHRYLVDFAEGTHRLFWADNRAYVEVNRPNDAELLRREFPRLVKDDARYTGATFPW